MRADRFEGVGDWLLETGEFPERRGSESGVNKAVLFPSGNPGVGDISEIRGEVHCEKSTSMTTRNTSSPGDRQPMRSGKEGKYRRCWLLLRLPFPDETDNHQYDRSCPEAASKQREYPELSTGGFSKGQRGVGR